MGFGYCAEHLYHTLVAKHRLQECFVTTRQPLRFAPPSRSVEVLSIAHGAGIPRHILEQVTHILVAAPPENGIDYFLQRHGSGLATLSSLRWLGYLSSTSVYGNHQGNWVTEASLCQPTHTTGRDRLSIEDHYMRLFYNQHIPVHIFRLSGIYGPRRSAFDQMKKPDCVRIDAPDKLFSRIHVDDIALSLYQSMATPTPGELFNLADYEPAASRTVLEYACSLANIKLPPLVSLQSAELSSRMKEFFADSKKVDGTKIRNMLSFDIQFPNYRSGLTNIFENEHH